MHCTFCGIFFGNDLLCFILPCSFISLGYDISIPPSIIPVNNAVYERKIHTQGFNYKRKRLSTL
jgi:hypothetical protein